MGIDRSEVIMRMKSAISEGMSASRFITAMKSAGLSYRRQTMLADYRSVGNTSKKEGAARYIRRDFKPTAAVTADVTWDLSREYMNKVKVHLRVSPGEPITERFVNIMSDTPLTPRQIEESVLEKMTEWSDSIPGVIERVTLWTVMRQVPA